MSNNGVKCQKSLFGSIGIVFLLQKLTLHSYISIYNKYRPKSK